LMAQEQIKLQDRQEKWVILNGSFLNS
jgi:hypothetical protein